MPGTRLSHERFIPRYRLQSFKVGADILDRDEMIIVILSQDLFSNQRFGANMGEIIRFIPKSERDRVRLIREARAIYDSIFPPADPVSEKQNKAPVSHTVSANAHRSDGVLLS
jgi:hypothetical protein